MKNKTSINEAQYTERTDYVQQKIEQMPTGELVFYARNSRTHSEIQVQQIAGSIQEFGFCNPVLIDAQNGIIAGHGRVMAAQLLKLESVPCLRLSHLTDAQKRAYVIADNRIALSAGWDEAMLANELSDLHADEFDMALLGFDADELAKLLAMEIQPEETSVEEVSKDAPEMTWVMIGIPTVRFGDINELVERIALVEECVVEISVK
jgi:ParB-like chromosome segregation protein Spo0J